MDLPTLHVIAPFHTVLNDSTTHCAFSGKARRFPKMMKPYGYRTVMYANEGAETEADETAVMHRKKEFEKWYPKQKPTEFHGDHAHYGTPAWAVFDGRLREALATRLGPRDIICHPFGHAHRDLVKAFPNHQHVETGIGYTDSPFGAWRIYESSAWLHWHLGRWEKDYSQDRGMVKAYSFVVPNYFDLDEWPTGDGSGGYVLFLGRIDPVKGTAIIAEIIRAFAAQKKRMKFVFAGQGNFEKEIMTPVMRDPKPDPAYLDIEYRGPVLGRARAKLVGDARCCLLASQFIEPFAGAVVEAQLCGTASVGPSFGAFRETIIEGVTGFTCVTLGDYLTAIESSGCLNRHWVANVSRMRYGLQTCGAEYDRIFRLLADQYGDGWNSLHSHRVPMPPVLDLDSDPLLVPPARLCYGLRQFPTSYPVPSAPSPEAAAPAHSEPAQSAQEPPVAPPA